MFSLDSMCLETLMSTKECDEIKVARRRMAGKMTRLQGADGYEMSSMPLTVSCPPGRTVTSRPIRSEQQGGACKVSREREQWERMLASLHETQPANQRLSASANSAVFDMSCVCI